MLEGTVSTLGQRTTRLPIYICLLEAEHPLGLQVYLNLWDAYLRVCGTNLERAARLPLLLQVWPVNVFTFDTNFVGGGRQTTFYQVVLTILA